MENTVINTSVINCFCVSPIQEISNVGKEEDFCKA